MRIEEFESKFELEHINANISSSDIEEWNPDREETENLNSYEMLGNLTTIEGLNNRQASEKGFEAKREIYRSSSIPVLSELDEYSKISWSENQIYDRTTDLSDSLVENILPVRIRNAEYPID